MPYPKEIKNIIIDYAQMYNCNLCNAYLNIEHNYMWENIWHHQSKHAYGLKKNMQYYYLKRKKPG